MHGEDYVCLGFLFGERYKVAYISDVSRFLPSTENCKHSLSIFTVDPAWPICYPANMLCIACLSSLIRSVLKNKNSNGTPYLMKANGLMNRFIIKWSNGKT